VATHSYYPEILRAFIQGWWQRRIAERRALLDSIKNVPCMDCGGEFPPYVMDFDHRSDKKFNIASRYKQAPLAVLLDEIAKCDVVCSNCHRVRTHG
jgi:hypothetical protein